ncbi:peptidoglycan-binding domain-containing protein [Rhodovulum sp. DZ06]|uniref:peptidoglycan-binding domain-containing protein n=1 Tax=Rhodovulum sp. DZ06 TaxID=3425126 RepID=UPI003D349C2B
MAIRYTCGDGECLPAIAELHGHFPKTVWAHPDNAGLRAARRYGEVLRPGDVVVIPDIAPAERAAGTGLRHRFRLRGIPELFRLRLLDALGRPRAGLDFALLVGGVRHEGVTDAHGRLEVPVPPDVQRGELEVTERGAVERYALTFSRLRPQDGTDGLLQRMVNLGLLAPGERDPQACAAALRAFQQKRGLEPTGRPDAATLETMEQVYRGEA